MRYVNMKAAKTYNWGIYFVLIFIGISLLPVSLVAKSGLKVAYTLTIEDYTTHEAFVTMQIENVTTSTLELEELGWGERNIKGQIKDLKAMKKSGEVLPVKQAQTEDYNFIIDTKGAHEIQVTYSIYKGDMLTNNHNVMGYIGEDFGVFSGGQVFLATKEKYGLQGVTVAFELPEGSTIATPFYKKDGVYDPNYYANQTTKNESEWENAYMSLYASTMSVGNFKRVEGPIIGGTQVITYIHNDLKYHEDLAGNIQQVIKYQTELFGGGATKVQVPYVVILFPDTTKTKVWSGESPFSQGVGIGNNQEPQHDFYAHQTFHRWNSWLWGWHVKSSNPKDTVFRLLMNEGLNRYYEGKFIIENMENLFNVSKGDVHFLTHQYENFLKDCPTDVAFINGKDPYGEGALFWLFMDLQMQAESNGQIGLDQVVAVLHKQFGNNQQQMDYHQVIRCIQQVTGKDYSTYFENYIFGKGGLGKALAPYFKDTDGDGYEDYVELLLGQSIYEKTTYQLKGMEVIMGLDTKGEIGNSESIKEYMLVGSKQATEAVREKGKLGAGAGLSNFLSQKLYEQYEDSILLIDLEKEKGYIPSLKRLVPNLSLETGLKKYKVGSKIFTVLVAPTADALMKWIDLKF
nr:hypothetical protein [uncultured Niameybacter sp.]